jgi:hypothetical protein
LNSSLKVADDDYSNGTGDSWPVLK